ncbi:magnesium transporter [Pueribacillus theae]|uniref:Magnesium transporter MgtE n=1 Tax=Pueribacillus theae TaxID=2171751 RepID=A0A2U1K6A1_9BACI|nr:magnesium transporter [Pueribacillus theae]PWA12689.1 magnesium transporter [Pueribacillus theae]
MTVQNENPQELYLEKLNQAIENDEIDFFRKNFLALHPYDQAKFYVTLHEEMRMRLYTYLSPKEMSEVYENIEELDDQKNLISEMEPFYAAQMLASMYVDNAVDVLNELSAEQIASYLALMDAHAAREIKQLLHYEEKTAGSIMTTEFVSIETHQTVREAMDILRFEAPTAETIYYIFVIDPSKKLVGVISLRDLIVADGNDKISEHMNEHVVSVSAGEDQESVAKIMKDYDFLALPVVDFQGHLLGIITHDDIVDVIDEEASDDYSKFAAISDVDAVYKNPISAAKKRLPWLIILLFLGMLTASLIGRFEKTLEQVAILAVFMPLIAGMAGNTGTQSLAVVIRRLATGDLEEESKMRLIMREAGTGLITGSTCGLLISVIVFIWKKSLFLGFLVGFSLFCTLIVATVAGAIIPLIMEKLKIDPAVASGPFIQTLNDILSVLIYFGLATTFMSYLL